MDVSVTTNAASAMAQASGVAGNKAAAKTGLGDIFEMLFASFQGQLDPTKAGLLTTTATNTTQVTDAKTVATTGQNGDAKIDENAEKLKAWLAQNWPPGETKPTDAELSAMAMMVMNQPNWLQQMPKLGEVQAELQQVSGSTGPGLARYAKGLAGALANLPTAKAQLIDPTDLIADRSPTEILAGKDKAADAAPKVSAVAAEANSNAPVVPTPTHATIKAATDKTLQQKLTALNDEPAKPAKSNENFFGVAAANQNGQTTAGDQQSDASADSDLMTAVKAAFSESKPAAEQAGNFTSHLPDDAAALGFMAPVSDRQLDATSKLTLTQASNANLYAQMPKLQDTNAASMAMGVYLQRSALTGQNQTFKVKMQPEELGDVEVTLKFMNGKMRAHISADKEETLKLLKGDSATLSDALRQAGVGADANSLSFSLNEGQQQAGGKNNKNGNQFAEAFNSDAELSAPIQLLAMPRVLAPGRVDKAI